MKSRKIETDDLQNLQQLFPDLYESQIKEAIMEKGTWMSGVQNSPLGSTLFSEATKRVLKSSFKPLTALPFKNWMTA